MSKNKGFTLVELMVVILIVGILAAASIPLMRGRVDSAKWAEASATAGTIRSAVRVYFMEHNGDKDKMKDVTGSLSDANIQTQLGFTEADLKGTYFEAKHYSVSEVDENGNAAISVTSDGDPAGSATMSAAGEWDVVLTSPSKK